MSKPKTPNLTDDYAAAVVDDLKLWANKVDKPAIPVDPAGDGKVDYYALNEAGHLIIVAASALKGYTRVDLINK